MEDSVSPLPSPPTKPPSRLALVFNRLAKISPRRLKIFLVVVLLPSFVLVGYLAIFSSEGVRPLFTKDSNTFVLKAEAADSLGVDLKSSFILTSKEAVSPEAVRDALKVDPPIEFDVKAKSKSEVILAPQSAMEANRVYRFILSTTQDTGNSQKARDYSWAFQIKNPLRVVSTLPSDRAVSVPIDSGIEVAFSAEGVQNIEKHFLIEPQVAGRFEVHKRTVVFLPQKPLAYKSLYKISVTRGLPFEGSTDTLGQDYTATFETTAGDLPESYFSFQRDLSQFKPNEPPALGVFLSYNNPVRALNITIYKFTDEAAFTKALRARGEVPSWSAYGFENFTYPTTGLNESAQFTAAVEGADQSRYVRFPAGLEPGFYIVSAFNGDQTDQTLLQVTRLSGYLSTSVSKSIVWINDLENRSPVAGASVSLLDSSSLKKTTRDDGTLLFDTPPEILNADFPSQYIRVEHSGSVLFLPVSYSQRIHSGDHSRATPPVSDLYWRYFYTDRALYLPSDTIKFWGLVKKREGSNPAVFKLVLSTNDINTYSAEPVYISQTEVTPSEAGTFSGEIPFENLQPGWYSLRLMLGDDQIISDSVEIQTYNKPVYKLDVTLDKPAVIVGDTINYTVSAKFFEGTPVPGLQLSYTGNRSGEITTDANGQAVVSYNTATGESSNTSPYNYSSLSVRPTLTEEGEINAYASARIFNSSYIVDAAADRSQDTGVVMGTVWTVDLLKLNSGGSQSRDDYKGSPVKDQTVNAKLYADHWEALVIGDYYDFIDKKVRQTYRWENHEQLVQELGVKTQDNGQFKMSFPLEKDTHYRIELTTADPQNRTELQDVYLYGREQTSLSKEVTLSSNKENYEVDEDVALAFKRGGEDMPSDGTYRYLYTLSQNGLKDYTVNSKSSYTFKFKSTYAPNITYHGVCFTGETYIEDHSSSWALEPGVSLALDEKNLTVKVTPDKESYAPGDTVNLSVQVTDSKERGVATEVNVNAIDEALAQLQWVGQSNPLYSLYSHVSSGLFQTYVSHQYPLGFNQGGGGGGGGERRDFKDNAFFSVVKTDSAGRGQAKFKLPDNLTSWRLTTQAISSDLLAGGSTTFIAVKKPLFVAATLNEEYLSADRPVITLRTFGESLQKDSKVKLTVVIDDNGPRQDFTDDEFSNVSYALPLLTVGDHKINIKASSGGYEDTLVRSVRIVSSRLTQSRVKSYAVPLQASIEGGRTTPTTIVFSDKTRSQYLSALWSLAHTVGERVDQEVAPVVSRKLLADYFGENLTSPEFSAVDYQSPNDGGVALLPYSSSELLLTAEIAVSAPEQFDQTQLKQYLYSTLSQGDATIENVSMALWGLAFLDEPVLTPVKRLLADNRISDLDRLYLLSALARSGDKETARSAFGEILGKYKEDVSPYLRFKLGRDQNEIAHATALASLTAVLVGAPEKDALTGYVFISTPTEILLNLQKIAILKNTLPTLSTESAKFAYEVSGKRQEVELQKGRSFKLQLNPAEVSQLKVTTLSGQIGLLGYYEEPAALADLAKDPTLSLNRVYKKNDQITTNFNSGDLIKIEVQPSFDPTSVDGKYAINDYLPSGLRIVSKLYFWGVRDNTVSYPQKIDRQKITFIQDKNSSRRIIYYARVLSAGEYIAEPTVVQSVVSPSRTNASAQQTINIR